MHDDDLKPDPLWYKDTIIYELHVRAFQDSNADGMGDFKGLTSRLDYLEDLGVTALWLLPFYPSPWRDDGYDIADYTSVHPAYGHTRDFREFMNEAHRRGLRVITELVINHTSDQHAWFQRARKAPPGSSLRDFYVWNDNADKYRDARIIFKDFESSNWSWDPVARQYYWHRFFSHQPDLNFENPAVHKAIFRVMDFWLKMGVDGMRLDAIPYLYEQEGTSCENLDATHRFLKKLRRHVDKSFQARMLLAEANQWPEETVPYFGAGDENHMAFHFPVMPRLFMAIRMEDRFPIIDIMKQTPAIPDNCQWAIFLRNHDELTLEMVTDEERDYMYRSYASDLRARINLGIRRRLAPLLGNDRRTIELMNCLLFSLPGTPVLYYGDEIGMGDNIYLGDRNGVRTPMQWSGDRNAGFSDANPQRLYLPAIIDPEYHFGTVNVEAQQSNPNSLLWWMKRIIALRKRYQAFGRGTIEFLYPDNRKVLVFLRQYQDETILVVVNLSRLVQYVDLDLSRFKGAVPTELFGRIEFPIISDRPLFLTLGPHAFYWFELHAAERRERIQVTTKEPEHSVRAATLRELAGGAARASFERLLPAYIVGQRWFRSKARAIRDVDLFDLIDMEVQGRDAVLCVIRVEYADGDPENYILPLIRTSAERAAQLKVEPIFELRRAQEEPLVIDAAFDPDFADSLLRSMASRQRMKGTEGELRATPLPLLRELGHDDLRARVLGVEQTNTSIAFGDRFVLKLYRKLEEGTGLDLEMGRYLTQHGFPHAPSVAGAVEFSVDGQTATVGVLHTYARNEGDAWEYTIDSLGPFYERAAAQPELPPQVDTSTHGLLQLAHAEPAALARDLIGAFLEDARLLGQRTAELHNVLAAEGESRDFEPEPFTIFYQRSLYQSMRNLTGRVFQALETRRETLPEHVRADADRIVGMSDDVLRRFRRLIDRRINAVRIRCHGDYHLGQVLFTGKDFCITDFEGEPLHPLSERRLKRNPLRDVAGMIRSFHYAAFSPLTKGESGVVVRSEDAQVLAGWATVWYGWVSGCFLAGYFETAHASLIPNSTEELEILLDAYLLEKAVYELGYELNNRPDWLVIPVKGILDLLTGAQ
ncbi:MAG TPA: maltose alpha-D-glucosyltransferase [Longimicrobiales bacterium]|nr:maltose alpha-D-glucosyltransferase [Longimicrobiales bacterium]